VGLSKAGGGPGKGADPDIWRKACAALTDRAEAEFFVHLAAGSKAARRAVAAAITGEAGRTIREQLARLSDGLSADDPPERLLRRAAGREQQARRRSNPIAINERFTCVHCGFEVPPAPGSAVRNHCPRCLRSLHVDGDVPGDRTATCRGLMDPEDPVLSEGEFRITHRCRRCGFTRRNRLAPDWSVEPDRLGDLWPDL